MRSRLLDLLRLALATLVIFSHSWGLLGRADPLQRATGLNFGEVAVCGFFVLSGYLISTSWKQAPGLGYFANRALRIVPAFAVAFLISVIVVGAIGSVDAGAYWSAINWPAEAQLLATLHAPAAYPQAFVGQAQPYLNGPLWTIKWEVLCYVLTPLFVFRRWTLYPLWIAALVAMFVYPATGTDVSAAPRFMAMFLTGAVLADLGWKPPALNLGKLPDFSYGTYLYGWPVQQLLIMAGLSSPLMLFAVATPLAWLVGLASWYGVERYALRLKGAVRRVGTPASTAPREPQSGYP